MHGYSLLLMTEVQESMLNIQGLLRPWLRMVQSYQLLNKCKLKQRQGTFCTNQTGKMKKCWGTESVKWNRIIPFLVEKELVGKSPLWWLVPLIWTQHFSVFILSREMYQDGYTSAFSIIGKKLGQIKCPILGDGWSIVLTWNEVSYITYGIIYR